MTSRKRLTATERRNVYDKMQGHCAYCGKPIELTDMQVDHVIPLCRGGVDDISNMMPTCRWCNHYKRNMLLDEWRNQIERIPDTLARDCYTYRRGVDFGMVIPTPSKVKFYFEEEAENESIQSMG